MRGMIRWFGLKASHLLGGDPIPNKKWKTFKDRKSLNIISRPLIHRQSQVFCMGSCFALEIKKVLRSMGYVVHPEESGIEVSLSSDEVFRPTALELVHFNTFTMLQEFEKAFGLWTQDPDDFWYVDRIKRGKTFRYFQDPYRRQVYCETKEGIRAITQAFDRAVQKGIMESDIYILTLGLIEVWKKNDNGRYSCAQPGDSFGGGHGQLSFVESTFSENFDNVKKIINLIHSRFPNRPIILTVSPVPLSLTFSGSDVFVANTEGKAVLRTVAGQASREFENVYYFPSFEICSMVEKYRLAKVYESDGRHVSRPMVKRIMDVFLETYQAK